MNHKKSHGFKPLSLQQLGAMPFPAIPSATSSATLAVWRDCSRWQRRIAPAGPKACKRSKWIDHETAMRQHGHLQTTDLNMLNMVTDLYMYLFSVRYVPLLKHKVGNPMPWHMNRGFGGSKKLALSNAQPSPVSNSRKRWPPSATSRTHRNLLGFTEAAWVGRTRMVGNTELIAKPLGIYLGRDLSSRSSINGRYLWQKLTNIHACHSHDEKPCDFLPIKKAPRMAADVGDMQVCKLISNIPTTKMPGNAP